MTIVLSVLVFTLELQTGVQVALTERQKLKLTVEQEEEITAEAIKQQARYQKTNYVTLTNLQYDTHTCSISHFNLNLADSWCLIIVCDECYPKLFPKISTRDI